MTDTTPRDDDRGESKTHSSGAESDGSNGHDPDGDRGGGEHREEAATPAEVDRLAESFRAAGEPFARVTVVRREPPVSANFGDRAIVTPEGELIGWIGGAACAQSVAVEEALDALERNEPALIGLAPDPDDVARPGLEAYPMTCHSGGTLELFVEPVRSLPHLVVVGDSPIARTLRRLAGETSFEVTVVAESDADAAAAHDVVTVDDTDAVAAAVEGATAVVVASVGEYDIAGVAAALRAEVPYVGLVASDPRRDELAVAVAEDLGIDAQAVVDRVTTPAGLDIGAKMPEEIAVSVLAELVAVRRGRVDTADPSLPAESRSSAGGESADRPDPDDGTDFDDPETAATDPEVAVDPVCGMDVVVGEAAATVTHDGETYHFCGQGCADAFETDPGKYLDEEVVAGE